MKPVIIGDATLYLGDCVEVMRNMPDNSVDSIVTDPPYELAFMGKDWDAQGIAFSPAVWTEALRVLKPGGHLLAFSGSRTYHRMTCAIEDAGFEIRDQIMWVYSSGFPKSHNLDNHRGKLTCACPHESTEPKTERHLHPVLNTNVSAPLDSSEGGGKVLQPSLPEQSAPAAGWQKLPSAEDGRGQPSLEGRRDDVQAQGELQGNSVLRAPESTAADGAGGRLHHGASGRDGGMVRVPADTNGSGTPRRSRSDEQPAQQPGAVADEQRPQTARAWPDCARCGLPVVPQGLGTALKPAHEPIVVARKPLEKGSTVAANVLQFGTGALNIDGCRVGMSQEDKDFILKTARPNTAGQHSGNQVYGAMKPTVNVHDAGRWPANLIHDGSDEVLAAFPDAKGQQGRVTGNEPTANGFSGTVKYGGMLGRSYSAEPRIELETSAARFFYCAKASRADRNEGLPSSDKPAVANGATMREREDAEWSERNGNYHPTVKPTDLMAYLCRLVTPPGGLVLDPFMGSGSTGKAAMREGFRFVGIDMTPEYVDIAAARIRHEISRAEAASAKIEKTPQLDLFAPERPAQVQESLL